MTIRPKSNTVSPCHSYNSSLIPAVGQMSLTSKIIAAEIMSDKLLNGPPLKHSVLVGTVKQIVEV